MFPIGTHVFITGSGKRLGRALAEAVLALGANVSAHFYQSQSEIEELRNWATQRGLGTVLPIQANLSDLNAIKAAATLSVNQLGPVNILINSASDFFPSPISSTTSAEWDSLFSLNLKAPYFLTQEIVKTMPSGSCILFIADVHGSRPIKNYGPYCATKAGLISLTKTLAKELAPNIRVNSLSPGTLLPADNASEREIEQAANRSLLGFVGSPKDFVQGALFLIRNEYVTGFDLIIDGGRSLA